MIVSGPALVAMGWAAMEAVVAPAALARDENLALLDRDGGADGRRGMGFGCQGRDPEQDRDRQSCSSHRCPPFQLSVNADLVGGKRLTRA
jgi:hypothetical protein